MACYGCKRLLPETLFHNHHPHPQAAGGRDLGTVQVCPTCHAACHAAARLLRQGLAPATRDLLTHVAGLEGAARLWQLVETEVRALAKPLPRPEQALTIEFPRGTYQRLRALARGILTPQGHPVGVARLVRLITEAWLQKNLPENSGSASKPVPGKPELV